MSKGTPITAFRIPAEVKTPAQAEAERRGETLTDVVLRALREYVGDTSPAPTAGLSVVTDPFMPPHPGPGRA